MAAMTSSGSRDVRERTRAGQGTGTPTTTRDLLVRLPCRWCLLRDVDDAGAGEIEFDVLVDGDRRMVRRALRASGARVVRSWGRSPHRQFTWWDASLDRPVRIDIVDELGFGSMRELRVDRGEHVLDGVTEVDGWPRPNSSSGQWLAVLHGLLDRDRLRPRDIAAIDPWAASDDDPVAGVLPDELRSEIAGAATASDWDALAARRGEIRAALTRPEPTRTMIRRRWRAVMRRTTKLQRAVLRPGVRIALLGPDGAGKTTTIEQLIGSGVVGSSVYLGVAPTELRRPSAFPGVALLRTIRRLWAAWLVATLRRRRGQSVALDRHPLEAVIGPVTTKRTTRLRRRILARVLPRPEHVVVLMAPAAVLHERKPEHDIADVVARRDRYLGLARRNGYPVIDTTAEPAEVLARINRAIHGFEQGGRTP